MSGVEMGTYDWLNPLVLPAARVTSAWLVALLGTAAAVLLSILLQVLMNKDPYPDIVGPEPHFFWGNIKEIMQKSYIIAHLDYFRRFGPIYKIRTFLSSYGVVITDPELAKEVTMRQFKTFHDRAIIFPKRDLNNRGLLMSRGGYWEGVRSAVIPLFHTSQLACFSHIMHHAADTLLQTLDSAAQSGHSIDITEGLQAMTINVIETSAFGLSYTKEGGTDKEFQEALVSHVRGIGKLRTSRVIATVLPWTVPLVYVIAEWLPWTADWRLARNRRIISKNCRQIIAKSRRAAASGSGGRDFLSLLVSARTKDTGRPLTDGEVQNLVHELLFAGSDTTSNTLSFAVYLISRHPNVEEKMVAEIRAFFRRQAMVDPTGKKQGGGEERMHPTYEELSEFPYTEQVIHETLRMYPAAPMIMREIGQNCHLAGLRLRKGDRVIVPIYSLHHNPAVFPEPHAFRPERFAPGVAEIEGRHPYAYLPFGAGPRMCIGYRFAMEEAKLALIRLYQRFTFTLDEAKMGKKPLELEAGIVLKPKHGVHIFVHPREN